MGLAKIGSCYSSWYENNESLAPVGPSAVVLFGPRPPAVKCQDLPNSVHCDFKFNGKQPCVLTKTNVSMPSALQRHDYVTVCNANYADQHLSTVFTLVFIHGNNMYSGQINIVSIGSLISGNKEVLFEQRFKQGQLRLRYALD